MQKIWGTLTPGTITNGIMHSKCTAHLHSIIQMFEYEIIFARFENFTPNWNWNGLTNVLDSRMTTTTTNSERKHTSTSFYKNFEFTTTTPANLHIQPSLVNFLFRRKDKWSKSIIMNCLKFVLKKCSTSFCMSNLRWRCMFVFVCVCAACVRECSFCAFGSFCCCCCCKFCWENWNAQTIAPASDATDSFSKR